MSLNFQGLSSIDIKIPKDQNESRVYLVKGSLVMYTLKSIVTVCYDKFWCK